MEPKAPDLGWWTGVAGLIGLLAGWLGGAAKTGWSLGKYDSRIKALEESKTQADKDAAEKKKKEDEEDISSRVQYIEEIAEELKGLPSMVADIKKTTDLLSRVVFLERGGLNVVTHEEHDKMQAHCQSLFRKDLDQLKFMMDQLIKSSGTEQLEMIAKTLTRLEKEFSRRVVQDNERRV